ncbi:N-6 DNA methylase [Spirosoma aerolatum]|uniref:N-6 DNA methylase n=1 Tax=Spirosoma aerolatum TaxID=1211326 RepID=UPI0014738E0D|nr:N-6 DNA methylase [Spirosoma aerolatum]
MAKSIRGLAYRHGTYNVFADFCEMAAISFSNTVDLRNCQKREERYLSIVKKYSSEEINLFPELLGMLTIEMESEPRDVLGELFHELELHNEHAGQFFTPYHLCEMMSKMTYGDEMQAIVDQKGFVTAHEPACGSGAMIIALAHTMLDKKINYQQCLHVSAIDLDSRCVHMAYVQFSLLNIPAVVYVGNTLTMEMRDAWYTPAHIIGGWNWRLNKPETTAMQKVIELLTTAEPAAPAKISIPNRPRPTTPLKRVKPINQLAIF